MLNCFGWSVPVSTAPTIKNHFGYSFAPVVNYHDYVFGMNCHVALVIFQIFGRVSSQTFIK